MRRCPAGFPMVLKGHGFRGMPLEPAIQAALAAEEKHADASLAFLNRPRLLHALAGLGSKEHTAERPSERRRLFQQHAASDQGADGSHSGKRSLVKRE